MILTVHQIHLILNHICSSMKYLLTESCLLDLACLLCPHNEHEDFMVDKLGIT